MRHTSGPYVISTPLLLGCLLIASSGCSFSRYQIRPFDEGHGPVAVDTPRELVMGILPEYRIEPPDVLQVTAVNVVPKAPYSLKIGDQIVIEVIGTVPDAPIRGLFPIQIGGIVNLGFSYGQVQVRGLTVEEAQEAIRKHLLDHLREPIVTVSLGQIGGIQQISGPRPVGLDGRINLGTYGTVNIVGLTIDEARKAIEDHLSEFLDQPEISVEVQTSNSKFYYVITQGAGLGDRIARVPVTGNETVLDAISTLGGLNQRTSTKIWISRPSKDGHGDQILLVDWRHVTQLGGSATNYQILPGDRVYVAEDKWVRLDNDLRKITRPFITISQFINLMLGTIRNLDQGLGGAAPTVFQGDPGIGGGVVNPIPPITQ